MNQIIRIYSSLIAIFMFLPLSAGIRYTVQIQRDSLSVVPANAADGSTYSVLRYCSFPLLQEEGEPAIPFKVVNLMVPSDGCAYSVRVLSSQKESFNLSDPVMPAQPPVPTSLNQYDIPFVSPAPRVYTGNSVYPLQMAEVNGDGYFDGCHRIISVQVNPFRYDPSANRLDVYTQLEIELTPLSQVASSTSPIYRRFKEGELDIPLLKSMVDNPEAVAAQASQNIVRMKNRAAGRVTYPYYMLVTTRALAPSFAPLIGWKRNKGLDARVVCIEDILADPRNQGDTKSFAVYAPVEDQHTTILNDSAGKLREYLSWAYQGGTRYVFLCGPVDKVPFRYGAGFENKWDWYKPGKDGYIKDDGKIPSDFYFSELNSNWNRDGDEYLGEKSELMDFSPELHVGRLICKNSIEVNHYLSKIMIYERNPGNGDYAYLKKALYMQADQMQRDKEAQKLMGEFGPYFNQHTLLEENVPPSDVNTVATFPLGKDVINELRNKYGYHAWLGHGSGSAVGTANKGLSAASFYGVVANDTCDKWLQNEPGNGLDNLKQPDYPAVAYSSSCHVSMYDKSFSQLPVGYPYTFAESYTVCSETGGVAFLGNTRYGWVGPSTNLHIEFIKQLKGSAKFRIGIAESFSKSEYAKNKRSDYHWLALTHNLMGCPEVAMWSDIPQQIAPAVLDQTENYLTVDAGSVSDSIAIGVRFFRTDGGESVFYNNPEHGVLSTTVFNKVSSSYVVTLTRHNRLPRVGDAIFQNTQISGQHYVFAHNVFAGNRVDLAGKEGELIVKPAARVVLDTTGEIVLDKGFSVERGAAFETKR